ncbi:MAG: leucine-rich repeat protein, partial [Clostridia bacterium]|nr:leucine-rich repeat protein [Clostridia bacterium]
MMKKFLSLLSIAALAAAIFCLLPMTAFASEVTGTCGENITYEYVSETKTVTLTGTGAMTDYASAAKSPFYNFRNELTTVVIGEGITTVGTYAFANQNKLTTISLPSTMTALKKGAFNQCR